MISRNVVVVMTICSIVLSSFRQCSGFMMIPTTHSISKICRSSITHIGNLDNSNSCSRGNRKELHFYEHHNNNNNHHIGVDRTVMTQLSFSSDNSDKKENKLPFYLDPNTKGGVIVLMFGLFLLTYIIYAATINVFQMNEIDAGIQIGMGFTVFSTLAWMSTYLFRVATKDMTYAKQLKDYENAVIAKRLEELDDDEIQALVEEVSAKDSF